MHIRIATLDDIELLIRLRLDYAAEDFGPQPKEIRETLRKQMREYFLTHINTRSFTAFIGEVEGKAAATAFLAVSEMPGSPLFPGGVKGTVLNVLTYPEYRGKGYASAVLRALIDKARELGVDTIELSATEAGRPVYERLGFKASKYTEMKFPLE